MADIAALSAWLRALPRLREIYLSGGEPLEHAGLEQLVGVAGECADRVILYSSGTTQVGAGLRPLDEARLRGLAARGVARIDLSFYSAEAALHESITASPGSFAAVVESAQRARRAGLVLGIHFVPLPANERSLLQVAELAGVLGADRLHLLAPAPQGRALRLVGLGLSQRVLNDVQRLREAKPVYELVLSSTIRRALGDVSPNERDRWQAGFLDVEGYLFPGEGRRLRVLRSAASVLEGSPAHGELG
jgi:MoaA/NifB/PqqE/SkfB family radical SAM enzyme